MSDAATTQTPPKASAPQAFAQITVNPDPGFPLVFEGLHMAEQLGRPFLMTLDASSSHPTGDLMALLGASVTVTYMKSAKDKSTAYYNGRLTHVSFLGMSGGSYRYQIELRPWMWVLSQTHDCKIFQNQSAWDIITSVCRAAGFTDFEDKRQNQCGSTVLENCVQYNESSLDFVTRLMERFGLYYFHTFDNDKHTAVFADDPNSHTALPQPVPYLKDMTEARVVNDHVWGLSSHLNMLSGTYTSGDYNFVTPSADLTSKTIKTGQHDYGTQEKYHFPGVYGDSTGGQAHTDVRMQALAAGRHTYSGQTNARLLQNGAKFTVTGATDSTMNQAYLVTGSTVTLSMAENKSGKQDQLSDTYLCVFEAIPATIPFKLPATTAQPTIQGHQSARVTGAPGDEITTDQYGRIKVKFPWDRAGPDDETSSTWLRVSHNQASQSFGGVALPRVGDEVLVSHLDGNPDRPIVTGRVYNTSQPHPTNLPDNKTQSGFKTNSSPGGGGFNQMLFEDKKGSEFLNVQAQKDYNLTVVTGNATHTIETGNHTTTVSMGDHTVTLDKGSHTTTVTAGNHKVSITAGQSVTEAAQSIELTVGGSSIKITPAGITLSAASITLQAGGAITLNGAPVAIN